MGGLVSRAYIQDLAENWGGDGEFHANDTSSHLYKNFRNDVSHLITLATPHYGSYSSVKIVGSGYGVWEDGIIELATEFGQGEDPEAPAQVDLSLASDFLWDLHQTDIAELNGGSSDIADHYLTIGGSKPAEGFKENFAKTFGHKESYSIYGSHQDLVVSLSSANLLDYDIPFLTSYRAHTEFPEEEDFAAVIYDFLLNGNRSDLATIHDYVIEQYITSDLLNQNDVPLHLISEEHNGNAVDYNRGAICYETVHSDNYEGKLYLKDNRLHIVPLKKPSNFSDMEKTRYFIEVEQYIYESERNLRITINLQGMTATAKYYELHEDIGYDLYYNQTKIKEGIEIPPCKTDYEVINLRLAGAKILANMFKSYIGSRNVHEVYINEIDSSAVFVASPDSTQGIIFSLITPDGEVIDSTTADNYENIEYVKDGRIHFYTLYSPESGIWTLDIFGENGTPYTASVHINSPIAFTVDMEKEFYNVTEEISLSVDLSDVIPIVDSVDDIYCELENLEGNLETFQLSDNGANGDTLANDSVYTVLFADLERGYYDAKVYLNTTYQGNQITRIGFNSFEVANQKPIASDLEFTFTEEDTFFTFDLDTLAVDDDGDTLSWAFVGGDTTYIETEVDTVNNTVSFSLLEQEPGIYSLYLEVADGEDGFDLLEVTAIILDTSWDFNSDGVYDMYDIQILISRFGLDINQFGKYDLNEDDAINEQDVKLLLEKWGEVKQ
jgi:hypothetical protein